MTLIEAIGDLVSDVASDLGFDISDKKEIPEGLEGLDERLARYLAPKGFISLGKLRRRSVRDGEIYVSYHIGEKDLKPGALKTLKETWRWAGSDTIVAVTFCKKNDDKGKLHYIFSNFYIGPDILQGSNSTFQGRTYYVELAHGARRDFTEVTFNKGRDYRYNPKKKFTEGLYARNYPTGRGSDYLDHYLADVVTYRATTKPGHCNSALGLNSIDIANFAKSYPKLKMEITNASSGLYETLLELVLAVPALLSRKVRRLMFAGSQLAKTGKAYLAYQLGIKPTLESLYAAHNVDIEDFYSFKVNGFSVYRSFTDKETGLPAVLPLDEGFTKNFFIQLVQKSANAAEIAEGLRVAPKEVSDEIDLNEQTIFISDYSITANMGDLLNMSIEREMVLKHGGHAALLAWDLSPVSFFTDWFTHVYKSLFIDLDLAAQDHLFLGTYSNKLTTITPIIEGEPSQVSSCFYRKCFSPAAVPAIPFQTAWRKWTNSSWRASIVAAIIASSDSSEVKLRK